MKRDEVIEKVKKIVVENTEIEVKEDVGVFSSESMDSLDTLLVLTELEKEFDISISDEMAADIAANNLSIEQLADKLIEEFKL